MYHWNINYDMNTFSNFYYLYRWINIDVFVNKDLRLKVSWGNKQTKVKMHLHRTLIDRDRKSGITKPRHEFIKNIILKNLKDLGFHDLLAIGMLYENRYTC